MTCRQTSSASLPAASDSTGSAAIVAHAIGIRLPARPASVDVDRRPASSGPNADPAAGRFPTDQSRCSTSSSAPRRRSERRRRRSAPLRLGTFEPVVRRRYDDQRLVGRELLGRAEGVALALDDQRRHPRPTSSSSSRDVSGLARGVQRERQREHRRGAEVVGGAARAAGAGAATAEDQRGPRSAAGRRRRPAHGVEDRRRRGDLAPGDPPGLLEPDHGDPLRRQRAPRARRGRGRRDRRRRRAEEAAWRAGCGTGRCAAGRRRAACPGADSVMPPPRRLDDSGTSSAGSGSASSGPLLRTLLTWVDTG